jgi:spore coat protein CotF
MAFTFQNFKRCNHKSDDQRSELNFCSATGTCIAGMMLKSLKSLSSVLIAFTIKTTSPHAKAVSKVKT